MFKVFCNYPLHTSAPEIFEAEALAYDENKYLIVREVQSGKLLSIKYCYIFLSKDCIEYVGDSFLDKLPGEESYHSYLKDI